MKSSDNVNADATSNVKIILDQNNVPIEELLGSVTTYNNVEGSETKSQQLRTSARVFKKMKLDSANAVPVVPEKKESAAKEEVKPEVKKPLRPIWSPEDKNLFFEALNDYGKDFEAIHSYISNKLKKKGLPESVIKTKDQIRHFYYRTWHKISKHLKFSEDVKKIAQELYGLINYGELRKKVCSVSEKTCIKLNELIYRGSVTIRIKGKTIRVKTPMCRALRKLNQLDETHDDLKLPTRVNVELRPKDMNSWLRVQEMSQNPLVKITLPLQKRLSTIIMCMSRKWKSLAAVAYEKTLLSTNNVTNECVPDIKIVEENKAILEPLMRFSPPTDAKIELPAINLSEYLTSHSVCLNAHEERIGVKVPGEQLWAIKGVKKGGTKRPRNESTSEKTSPVAKQSTSIISTDNNENCISDPDLPPDVSEVIDEAVNTILALQQQDLIDEEKTEKSCVVKEDVEEVTDTEKKVQDIVKIKTGWTSQDCGTLTVGELYLMFGSDSRLILEYSWDNHVDKPPKTELKTCDTSDTISEEQEQSDHNASDKLQDSTETKSNTTEDESFQSFCDNNDLALTLQRLLSVAKLHYRKNMVRCPCGHVCGNNRNNNIVRNRNISHKNPKVIVGSMEKVLDMQEKLAPTDSSTTETACATSTATLVPIVIQPSPTAIFRRPNSPSIESWRAQIDQSIQRLKPRYCNRRGRPRAKQVVVERKLPLLANKADSGRILLMNIISQDVNSGPRTIAPKIVNVDKLEHNITGTISIMEPQYSINDNIPEYNLINNVHANINVTSLKEGPFNLMSAEQNLAQSGNANVVMATNDVPGNIQISDNATTPSRVGSPTSISNLLELALTPHENDIILNNAVSGGKEDTGIPSFVGLLSSGISNTTPPSSPSRILKENDNQWLNSEVADFSLSSFLGHLDSPMKQNHISPTTVGDDTRLSHDMDAQLQSLLTESSVDYMAKFADLAAEVVSSDSKK